MHGGMESEWRKVSFLKKTQRRFKKKWMRSFHGVSVIIPSYDHVNKELLFKAVDSCLYSKGAFKIEILIGVNGDDANGWHESIKQKYAGRHGLPNDFSPKNKKWSRRSVKIFRAKEKGQSAGRNICLDNARGKYIFFLDDDDYLTDGFLSMLFYQMHREICFAMGNFLLINEEGKKYETKRIQRILGEKRSKVYRVKKIRKKNYLLFTSMCGKLFKRDFIEGKWLDKKYKIGEDEAFMLNLLDRLLGKKIFITNSKEENYIRLRNLSSVSRKSKGALSDNVDSENLHYEFNQRFDLVRKLCNDTISDFSQIKRDFVFCVAVYLQLKLSLKYFNSINASSHVEEINKVLKETNISHISQLLFAELAPGEKITNKARAIFEHIYAEEKIKDKKFDTAPPCVL
jgi:glycosyltransferase involved in cell wall biosynthesis